MTREEAKRILLLYRPEMGGDSEFAEALNEARRDPELGHWLEQHLATQALLRQKFSQIPIPVDLKERILAGHKIIRPVFWRRRVGWIAAAASVAALICLAAWFGGERKPDRFADYCLRMVQIVLREYRMDILNTDGEQVRQYHQTRGAPADYTIPQGLQKVAVKGGGLLGWRGHPVSMVCFDRGNQQLLYLFVLDRNAAKDTPPSDSPKIAKVNKLTTATWSSGKWTYLLATEEDSIGKYL